MPYQEAAAIGESFIRDHAAVGHKGFFISDYNIKLAGVYQNEIDYRIIYLLSTELFGVKKQKFILIELDKENGNIYKVAVSKNKKSEEVLFL